MTRSESEERFFTQAHAPPPAAASGDWQRVATALWRRLDTPGFELCHLWTTASRIVMQGEVLNAVAGVPRSVRYHVVCAADWTTARAFVSLQTGGSVRSCEVRREANGSWFVNDDRQPRLQGLSDIDLGFTPATNTLPVRRLNLAVGESSEVTAAWMRFPELTMEPLVQRYTRVEANLYAYESAGGAFRASIVTDEHGLVTTYQGLFQRAAQQP